MGKCKNTRKQLPRGLVVKNPPANAGDANSIPGPGKSSGEGNGNPLQYLCLENPMDGGTWLGYSPWGHKELDPTERLHSLIHTYIFVFFFFNMSTQEK